MFYLLFFSDCNFVHLMTQDVCSFFRYGTLMYLTPSLPRSKGIKTGSKLLVNILLFQVVVLSSRMEPSTILILSKMLVLSSSNVLCFYYLFIYHFFYLHHSVSTVFLIPVIVNSFFSYNVLCFRYFINNCIGKSLFFIFFLAIQE